jgi:lysophospholipase L1-like esterase
MTGVTCTARDAQSRSASCGFTVSVARPPTLTATRFLAFGDSITGGRLGNDCGLNRPQCVVMSAEERLAAVMDDLRFLRAGATYSSVAYPLQLTALLAARYTTQVITITNEGQAGEAVTNSDAMDRFRAALNLYRPEVVLLQEGVNDLHGYGVPAVVAVADALGQMVREARGRGMRVYVGTLLPERECACRAFSPQLITPANDRIRAMAVAQGALLVDLHQAFGNQTSTLLDLDGLHPNEAGYRRMAETFFDAIYATLEAR